MQGVVNTILHVGVSGASAQNADYWSVVQYVDNPSYAHTNNNLFLGQ